jgi:ATP-dependent DNA ligase
MRELIPQRLIRVPEPFDHPAFVFEAKIDGVRALAQIRGHQCELISRNGHTFSSWPQLADEIAHADSLSIGGARRRDLLSQAGRPQRFLFAAVPA